MIQDQLQGMGWVTREEKKNEAEDGIVIVTSNDDLFPPVSSCFSTALRSKVSARAFLGNMYPAKATSDLAPRDDY